MNKLLFKIFENGILSRIYRERLGEPFLYNLVSIYYFFFGSFQRKIEYDLVPRQPYAFGINDAFQIASIQNSKKIYIIEFGVAAGAGLFNMAFIAKKLSKDYGIDYEIIGFDTGKGMPAAIDYRDHPEKYREGDFPPGKLNQSNVPSKCKLYYGDIQDEIKKFIKDIEGENAQIGFISLDVDYYSSTIKCFEIFDLPSSQLLVRVPTYLDDVNNVDHNEYCGELLAINEFNSQQNKKRKVCIMNQLKHWRVFKNALYLDQMYYLHVLDSKLRTPGSKTSRQAVTLKNNYL